MPTWHHSGYR